MRNKLLIWFNSHGEDLALLWRTGQGGWVRRGATICEGSALLEAQTALDVTYGMWPVCVNDAGAPRCGQKSSHHNARRQPRPPRNNRPESVPWDQNWENGSGLLHEGCHNNIPQAGWPQQNKCIFLTLVETGNPRSRCWQSWFLLRPVSPASRWPPLAASARGCPVGVHCWCLSVS